MPGAEQGGAKQGVARRWTALAALVTVLLTACSGNPAPDAAVIRPAATTSSRPVSDVRVALAYVNPDPIADPASAAAISAVKRAITDFGVQATMVPAAEKGQSQEGITARLRQLATSGYNPVIMLGRSYSGPLDVVAPDFPRTQFAIVDGPVNPAKNVTQLQFDQVQGTFLVGTIAAQASRTKKVGFVGGVSSPALDSFAEAFTQGVHAVDPSVKVAVGYIAFEGSGFSDPVAGQKLATQMIKQGNDVLFTVAFNSNPGVFAAAASRRTMAIGMETDEYARASASERPAILTSLIKDPGVPVYTMIASAVRGRMLTGAHTFGVQGGAVRYATSNPLVKPYEAAANQYAQKLAAGSITVKR